MNHRNALVFRAIVPVFTFLAVALLALSVPPLSPPRVSAAPNASYDWLQFDFNSQHSGNNTLESTITAANVNTLQLAFQVSLPDIADSAPAYLSGVTTIHGTQDLLFVTTKDGHIQARDAQSGAVLWTHQYGPNGCHINQGSIDCFTTSSPVIDPNRQFVYSYGLDGYVHKYQVGDGTEIKSGGFPELATRKGFDEKESPALSFANANGTTFLYVTNGGYPGDNGDYQGHVTAINLANGTQRVFNTLCSNQGNVHFVEQPNTPDCPNVQSAVWARAGVIYDADTNRIYAATGNGNFDPSQHDWGDTVLALNPDASGTLGDPLDTYTPKNFQNLQNGDTDLGSTAPAILPAPSASRFQHIAVQSGKDALLRLISLDNLSRKNGVGLTGGQIGKIIGVPQGGEVLTQPAVWVKPDNQRTFVFVVNDNGISALKLLLDSKGKPFLKPRWQNGNGGSSPILANNVLYYAGGGNVWALDPTNGNVLWNDTQIGGIHWSSPIVVNGYLYITDASGNLTGYHLAGH